MGLCWVVDHRNAKIMLTETRQKFVSPSHKQHRRSRTDVVLHGPGTRLLLFFCSTKFALKLMVSGGGILIPSSTMEGQGRRVLLRESFQKFLEAVQDAFIYIPLARM